MPAGLCSQTRRPLPLADLANSRRYRHDERRPQYSHRHPERLPNSRPRARHPRDSAPPRRREIRAGGEHRACLSRRWIIGGRRDASRSTSEAVLSETLAAFEDAFERLLPDEEARARATSTEEEIRSVAVRRILVELTTV
jgi:hypothetical protein